MTRRISAAFSPEEREQLARLKTPEDVQTFVDGMAYHDEITCRSPRRVMRDRKAHCFEGAMLAAAALETLGHPPTLIDMGAVRDDAHVIALFRRHGRIGSIGKSNFSGLRYRAPVYTTLRELVMSYFDDYFNSDGERTLRSYSVPLKLTERVYQGWRTAEEDLDPIGDHLDRLHHYRLMTPRMEKELVRVDPRLLAAGLLGANEKGLWRPDKA